jgi:hypothetical protein
VVVSWLMTVYVSFAQPFDTPRKNYMEVFNEQMLFIIGLHELVLLGLIDGYKSKQLVGNMMIFFIMLTIGINVIVAGGTMVFEMYRRSRKEYLFKKSLRNISKIKMDRKHKGEQVFVQ